MTVRLTEPDKMRDFGAYKYVRLGEEFRFIELLGIEKHVDMVDVGEAVDSAGMVGTYGGCFKMIAYGSESLGVGWTGCDAEMLERALNRKIQE